MYREIKIRITAMSQKPCKLEDNKVTSLKH